MKYIVYLNFVIENIFYKVIFWIDEVIKILNVFFMDNVSMFMLFKI